MKKKAKKVSTNDRRFPILKKPLKSPPTIGHIPESKPPVSLVAVADRLDEHYSGNQFDEIDVDVEVDYNEDEIGEGATKPEDVTEVSITLTGSPFGQNYFDHDAFTEALWFDVCDVAGWHGDDEDDAPFTLRPVRWSDKSPPSVPGKIVVAWRHGAEIEITLFWTPATEKGRRHLRSLHNGDAAVASKSHDAK